MFPAIEFCLFFCCFAVVSRTVEGSTQIEPKLTKSFRCDYTYFNEAEGYLKFQEMPADFEEARLRCHLEGSILASPINMGLQSAIKKLLRQNGKTILTGIHATFSSGDFCSIEGVPLSKIPHEWAPNDPFNFKNAEKCITLIPNGRINDVNCNIPHPYVCYKKGNNIMELNACGTSDNEYQLDSRTGSCYKFHRLPRTWSRAYMTCAAEDGHLAILNSETEAEVIRELFAKNPGNVIQGNSKDMAFVGVHDWNEHGEFLTIHGQTLKEAGYDKFSPGEPNNATTSTGTGQFCGGVYRSAMFDDVWCENRYAFICEKNSGDTCS